MSNSLLKPNKIINVSKNESYHLLALMEVASPDLEKQGFFAVVFVNREYNGQQESIFPKKALCSAP
nr:hypothetical protein [uncultured Flavobacterium sp.]